MFEVCTEMALNPGTKLGSYEVLCSLGAGGMGEVYRARDSRLNREVALKVLPEILASDPERMARFKREAQVLASLNHPNIATIYGFEESDGVRALAMELVEGHTLAERIAGTHPRTPGSSSPGKPKSAGPGDATLGAPLQIDEALAISKQIAEALEYAHDRGIVHRDLKPANIEIAPDGTAKVLDFGLAKALETDSSLSSNVSTSPTLTAMATQAGVIIGTAAYMSPEQARGKSVDRRADIWSFGCVHYEMFSGQRLFEGETVTDVLAAVVRAHPDWAALPAEMPRRINQLIRRCLTKDPRQRLRDIGEARITIEQAISGVDTETPQPAGPVMAAPQPRQSTFKRASMWRGCCGHCRSGSPGHRLFRKVNHYRAHNPLHHLATRKRILCVLGDLWRRGGHIT
jgi:eukaryotic-like serine/threonine-protein kinase